MKHDPRIQGSLAPHHMLIAKTYSGLAPLARNLNAVDRALECLRKAGGEPHSAQIRALRQELRAYTPSITLIGQVKAGKTSLANAMAGMVGLLPSDINPWTSVVTSMMLSPRCLAPQEKAHFQFFTDAEWDNLLTTGGRVGELASRAGADQELEKVRSQLEAMRNAARARLGKQFEMLLGQTHDYGYVDAELVSRYVCLGDEDDGDPSQGRFADITRSAELTLSQPALPVQLCLRDTPGVNDTFMVREQITVNAIRGSRLCVVVLSAHQALSNVDLALVRLIANVPARDVVIFVNRIDELTDPARDIPEIKASIQATLKTLNMTTEAEIIFGSAHWANAALSGDLGRMGRDSAAALLNWAREQTMHWDKAGDTTDVVWTLSGLPTLGKVLSDRITVGDGAAALARLSSAARNVASSISASHEIDERRLVERKTTSTDKHGIGAAFDSIAQDATNSLGQVLSALTEDLDLRLAKAQETFVGRGTTALVRHLENYGEQVEWTYDPSGLRLLLKSSYNVFCAKLHNQVEAIFQDVAQRVQSLVEESFGLLHQGFALEPPTLQAPPNPVILGQTIALDIRGNWWSRWWRKRRDHASYAEEFRSLIEAEIAPMVTALSKDHAQPHSDDLMKTLETFLADQRTMITRLASQSERDLDQIRAEQARDANARADALAEAQSILTDMGSAHRVQGGE